VLYVYLTDTFLSYRERRLTVIYVYLTDTVMCLSYTERRLTVLYCYLTEYILTYRERRLCKTFT